MQVAVNRSGIASFISQSSFPSVIQDKSIVLVGSDYIQANYRQDIFITLGIPFPANLDKAVIKRRAEYLAGRIVAIEALNKLGVNVCNIPTGQHRSPVWPQGIIASITHTNSAAFCAAARQQDIKYLGLDHENWLTLAAVRDIKSSIISDGEEQLLKQSAMVFERAFTLVFSAKESLFKALYPEVKAYFDFSAAQIVKLDTAAKTFTLTLTETLTPALTAGAKFQGSFSFDDQAILTLISQRHD